MGPGGQLSEAVSRDYHFYGHAAAGRLAIARSLAEAIFRGCEGVLTPFPCRGYGCRSLGRDGEPPGGRMSVEVIVT